MRARCLSILALCFLLVALSACQALSDSPTGDSSEPVDTAAEQMLALVNEARANGYHCGSAGYFAATSPLKLNAQLTAAAQKHSEDMAAAEEMSHTTPAGAIHYTPGMSPFERMRAEGYYWTAGENIAWGYRSVESVMQGWLSSAGHCANIMNPHFTEFGVGAKDHYWTQIFGAPR